MTTSLLQAETELETYDGWLSEEGDGPPQGSPRRGNGEAVRVMVAVDATKDLTMDALEWALINVVQDGDTVTLLGVIPDGDFLCGVNTKVVLEAIMSKLSACWRGSEQILEQHELLEDEVSKKKEVFQNLSMLQHFYKICEKKGVNLDVKIVAGRTKYMVVQQAEDMEATWVILDKHLRGGKGFYEQHLLCNVVLMKRRNVGDILRVSYKY
ncbi:unnamed protein product [Calypogeia fissa]